MQLRIVSGWQFVLLLFLSAFLDIQCRSAPLLPLASVTGLSVYIQVSLQYLASSIAIGNDFSLISLDSSFFFIRGTVAQIEIDFVLSLHGGRSGRAFWVLTKVTLAVLHCVCSTVIVSLLQSWIFLAFLWITVSVWCFPSFSGAIPVVGSILVLLSRCP